MAAKKPAPSLEYDIRIAWTFPLVVVLLGQIMGYLNRSSVNEHPHYGYGQFYMLWNAAMLVLPFAGIFWGIKYAKSSEGKVAILLNIILLAYALFLPHSTVTGV